MLKENFLRQPKKIEDLISLWIILSEFIHLIASEANEICNKQTKKTISPEHVIQALESLGFHNYIKVHRLFF